MSFRFSLRTALIVFTVIAVAAWLVRDVGTAAAWVAALAAFAGFIVLGLLANAATYGFVRFLGRLEARRRSGQGGDRRAN